MYTQMRVTVCDIRGYTHVSDWQDLPRPVENDAELLRVLGESGDGPVVALMSGQPRVFSQHTYVDVEAR